MKKISNLNKYVIIYRSNLSKLSMILKHNIILMRYYNKILLH